MVAQLYRLPYPCLDFIPFLGTESVQNLHPNPRARPTSSRCAQYIGYCQSVQHALSALTDLAEFLYFPQLAKAPLAAVDEFSRS